MTQPAAHFKVNKGETIGIFSPSSFVEEDKLRTGINILENMGFKTYIHPQTLLRNNQSAGTAQQKADAFHALLTNPEIKAIMAASGGNRSCHMLDYINWDIVKNNPKLLIGFSDNTVLLNAINQKANLMSLYGPTILHLEKIDEESLQSLQTSLQEKTIKYNLVGAKHINPGFAKAPIIGGTLTAFQSMIGTQYMPSAQGKILLLEDTYEETSRIDRALWQLRKSLPFEELSGIIFGHFSHMQDTGRIPFGFSFEGIVKENTKGLDIPIIINAPFGHGTNFYPIPINMDVSLNATDDEVSITY